MWEDRNSVIISEIWVFFRWNRAKKQRTMSLRSHVESFIQWAAAGEEVSVYKERVLCSVYGCYWHILVCVFMCVRCVWGSAERPSCWSLQTDLVLLPADVGVCVCVCVCVCVIGLCCSNTAQSVPADPPQHIHSTDGLHGAGPRYKLELKQDGSRSVTWLHMQQVNNQTGSIQFLIWSRVEVAAGKQDSPDVPLSSNACQLLRGDPEAVPGQMRYIISPACSGFTISREPLREGAQEDPDQMLNHLNSELVLLVSEICLFFGRYPKTTDEGSLLTPHWSTCWSQAPFYPHSRPRRRDTWTPPAELCWWQKTPCRCFCYINAWVITIWWENIEQYDTFFCFEYFSFNTLSTFSW